AAAETAAEAAKTAEAAETAAAAQTEQWLTTKETLALAQISRTTLHLKTKAGTFPQAIKIGKKCVWIRSEIDQWMNGVTYTVNIK
ncbi:helix-turn-helix transcriptional regulator, partial [Thiolapillus sp.]|uniref:helix-turn-helix transcriptional regulator n=1 Tax=Thiolapillus sp. TaxID=2017437 RepID=UPI003AF75B3C